MFNLPPLTAQQTYLFEEWDASKKAPLTELQNELQQRIVSTTDNSNNLYVAASILNETTGVHDLLLAKYDHTGHLLWDDQFNISDEGDAFAGAIALDASNNPVITGAVFNGNNNFDALTLKYSTSGTYQWHALYNGSASHYDGGSALKIDSSGNIYVSGVSANTSTLMDYLTLKYNNSGSQLWASLFDGEGLLDVTAAINHSGNTVRTFGAVQKGLDQWDLVVVVYNASDGDYVSEYSTLPNPVNIEQINGFTTDASGNIYVTGVAVNSGTGRDFITAKLDATLDLEWINYKNSGGSAHDVAKAVAVDGSGNVYVTGYATTSNGRDFMTVKYAPGGSEQWTVFHNGATNKDDEGTDIAVDLEGNIFVTGHSNEHGTTDFHTFWLNATDGSILWEARFNSVFNRDDLASVLRIDGQGSLLVTGRTTSLDHDSEEGQEVTTVKYRRTEIVIPPDAEAPSSAIYFIKNNGQLLDTDKESVPGIKYYSERTYPGLYFFNDKISMVLSLIDEDTSTVDTMCRVDMLLGADIREQVVMALEEQADYFNYYFGHIPEGRERVSLHQRLVHINAFDGIDLHHTSNVAGIKYDFVIKPGADPGDINLTFDGQTGLNLNENGELVIETSIGNIILAKPRAYEIDNGLEVALQWTPKYNVDSDIVTFVTDSYDDGKAMVIRISKAPEEPDEPCQMWSTYFGAKETEVINAVDVDASGNIYICGYTASMTNFPVTQGAFQANFNGINDAFAFRFDKNGVREWGTYCGGSQILFHSLGNDRAYDIAADAIGYVYFVGATNSTDFPKKQNPPAHFDAVFQSLLNFSRQSRSFIVKLKQGDGALLWATHFGEHLSRHETITTLEVTLDNHLVVGGYMQYPEPDYLNFPFATPGNAHHEDYGSNFIAEFNLQNEVIWATLFSTGDNSPGASYAGNIITDISYDNEDNLFITGNIVEPDEEDFLTPNLEGGDIWDTHNGGVDAFIAKFSNERTLVWATFFGGSADEESSSVACDSDGNLFVSGFTKSADFPIKALSGTNIYNDATLNGASDLFVAKFTNSGTQIWTTYFGGDGKDYQPVGHAIYLDYSGGYGGSSLAIDVSDNVFITGVTDSPDLPTNTTSCTPFCYYYQYLNQQGGNTNTDAFLLVFNQGLQKQFLTYWGGNSNEVSGEGDHGLGLATFQVDYVVFVGSTISTSPTMPVASLVQDSYYEPVNLGKYDGFLTELKLNKIVNCTPVQANNTAGSFVDIKVFPVPGGDFVYVETDQQLKDTPVEVVIVNLLGQVVYRQQFEQFYSSNPLMLDVHHLFSGNYFLTLISAGKIGTAKIIKH